jgi:hypothetical protein
MGHGPYLHPVSVDDDVYPSRVAQELGVWPLRDRCSVRGSRATTSLLIARITSNVVTRRAGSRGFVRGFQQTAEFLSHRYRWGSQLAYDFTPIADPTFDGSLQMVGPPASGVTDFRGVTGGDCDALEPSSRSHRTSTSRASGESD